MPNYFIISEPLTKFRETLANQLNETEDAASEGYENADVEAAMLSRLLENYDKAGVRL
jgi:hypothetical protein